MELTTQNKNLPILSEIRLLESIATNLDIKPQRLKLILKADGYPISEMDKKDVALNVSATLAICSSIYCGMQTSKTTELLFQEATNFVYKFYSYLGIEEIKEAFAMSSANYFDGIDMKAYFGTFTIAMLGDILTAYGNYRNKVIFKTQQEFEKQNAEQKRNEKISELSALHRVEVLKKLSEAKGKNLYESYEQIPTYYCQILIDNNLLNIAHERKVQIWEQAKELSKREFQLIAGNTNRIFEAKSARNILEQITSGLENQNFKDSATRIYSKLLVFEYLK